MLTTRNSAFRVIMLSLMKQSLTKVLQYCSVKTMSTAKILEEPYHKVTEMPRQKLRGPVFQS